MAPAVFTKYELIVTADRLIVVLIMVIDLVSDSSSIIGGETSILVCLVAWLLLLLLSIFALQRSGLDRRMTPWLVLLMVKLLGLGIQEVFIIDEFITPTLSSFRFLVFFLFLNDVLVLERVFSWRLMSLAIQTLPINVTVATVPPSNPKHLMLLLQNFNGVLLIVLLGRRTVACRVLPRQV